MSSPQQQLKNNDSFSPEVTVALEPAPGKELSPTVQSIQKGRWIVGQIFGFLAELFSNTIKLFNEYKQLIIGIALIVATLIATRLILAVMGAFNELPLLAPIFKLIGLGYSIWFINRYLLTAPKRQELVGEIQAVVKEQDNDVMMTTKSEQLYKPGEIVPHSGQYEVINPDGQSEGRFVTSTKGEHFPPTPEVGMHYKLAYPTQHKQ